MKTELKHLNAKGNGEVDYDYLHDIIFFKVKDRGYQKSIEFEDIILDIDKDGFVTSIQIFDASNLFKLSREELRSIKKWAFEIKVENNVINIQLIFSVINRNKIIERGQNIIRKSPSLLKNSEVYVEIKD